MTTKLDSRLCGNDNQAGFPPSRGWQV